MNQNSKFKTQNPTAGAADASLKRANPWAIAILGVNATRRIVGRFRNRSDADGHLYHLNRLMPKSRLVVFYDPPELNIREASDTSSTVGDFLLQSMRRTL